VKTGFIKTSMAGIALCSLLGLVRADELDDAYTNLKNAVEKKDADGVKKGATETLKAVRAASAGDADAKKQAAEVETYTEYALAATAQQTGVDPSKVADLVDALLAQNPKSKYLDLNCMRVYVNAVYSAAQNASAKSPDRALALSNKLVTVMKARTKPEGVSEADWDNLKNAALSNGYFLAGVVYGQKSAWLDCDRNLRAALPSLTDQPRRGAALFWLGMSNYQFGKLTQDRTRMQQGQKYSEESAAIPGPYQAQARTNAYAMKTAK
jgi:hypothetical protein